METTLDSKYYRTNSTSSSGSSSSENATNKNELSKNAFLNLMVTQLRYQDPLNPTNDKEFLAQMAQFTTLEQMQNMNKNMAFSQGTSLIGKVVQGTLVNEDTLEYESVEGKVEGVKMKSGKVYLAVGEKEVPLDNVEAVSEVDSEEKESEDNATDNNTNSED